MKLGISDKIFILCLILLVGWLVMIVFQKSWSIDVNLINAVGNATLFVIGAMVGAYIQKGEENGKKGK